jgi:predicted metal-binding protein
MILEVFAEWHFEVGDHQGIRRVLIMSQTEEQRFAELLEVALQEGAKVARLIPTSMVVIDERVRLKCEIPRCSGFGQYLTCPPHTMSLERFSRILSLYKWCMLVQVEAAAFKSGLRFATGLTGGCCILCEKCVAINTSEACRFPFRARPAMEGVGIDVYQTTQNAGLAIHLSSSKNVLWTGMILLE